MAAGVAPRVGPAGPLRREAQRLDPQLGFPSGRSRPFAALRREHLHPARYALAFSENLFGAALFGFPLFAAGASPIAVYNVLFLLGMFLSALAGVAAGPGSHGRPGRLAAGRSGLRVRSVADSQIPHIQHQWGAFLPLLLLFFLRSLRTGAPRDRVLFGVCLAWNALCNVHYAIFSLVLLVVSGLWAWLSGGAAERRRLLALLPAAVVAGAVVSVFFLPYLRSSELYGFERSTAEAETYSGRLSDFLSAGSRNRLYGPITQRFFKPEGDFFPGIVPFLLALAAFGRRCRAEEGAPAPPEPPLGSHHAGASRSPAIALDALLLLLAVLWVAASLRPGLRIGPLRLGDPGRLLVLATVGLFLRLVFAFPRFSRYRNLGDFIARSRLEPLAILAAGITGAGVVIALGLHTPFYRFLFDSFGPVFRGIRAPSRGIALFHLGLGLLAAEGLSRVARRASRAAARSLLFALVLVVVGVEYRAWPIEVHPVEAEPAAVYGWLARTPIPQAVMEWPLGFLLDYEYELRSTAHWKPIVNGASGFAPPLYTALSTELQRRPIPDAVWDRVRDVGASVLVFHPHDAPGSVLLATLVAVRRGLEDRRIEILDSFPHGPDADYVFTVSSSPPFDAEVSPERRRKVAESFDHLILRPGADTSPPLVLLDFPPARYQVAPGDIAYGWAADDSGIASGRVSTETGEEVPATFGSGRPEVGKLLWGFANAREPGFHFAIPKLAPGDHELIVRVEAVDGGKTELRRSIRVR